MSNKIHMVDLKGQYEKIKDEVDTAIQEVINTTAFINGPAVSEFVEAFATYNNVNNVITCGNGTDAIQIALMTLGLKPGDEVILPVQTYVATAEVIALLQLTPVFVDVDAETHNLYVVEDAAQAVGASYTFADGTVKKAGTIGDIGCTSFFPSKNLGCFGDGGAMLINDDALAKRAKMIANHGQSIKYHHDVIGCNSRLDTIQAAVLKVKLPYLDDYNLARNRVANYYSTV